MAIYDNSTLNTSLTSLAFNHVLPGIIPIVVKKNGLLFEILGKQESGSTPSGGPKFERMEIVSGTKFETTLMGVLPTISTVAAGSAEYAAATMVYDSNTFGAATFDLCHYAHNHALPESEFDKIAGGDQKQRESFVKLKAMAVQKGIEATLGTALSAASAPDATHPGGWCYAVSDAQTGTPDESSYGTYGTIDRTAAANADYRGYVARSTGVLTITKIMSARDNAVLAGGYPSVGVCNVTVFGNVRALVQGQAIITNSPRLSELGGEWFDVMGIRFHLDKYVGKDAGGTNDQLGLIDPESWVYVQSASGLQGEIIPPQQARYLQAAGHIHVSLWSSFICKAPSHNAKLVGITG